MIRRFTVAILLALGLLWPLSSHLARADYPKPSPFPIYWELTFDHSTPKRLAVQVPGDPVPTAYWYMTYTVTNKTDKEQVFYPVLEMLTEDGNVARSDDKVAPAVFEAIKTREEGKYMVGAFQIGGEIRLGPDQAQDGIAIWPETMPRMGTFSIFVSGLSGEYTLVKGPDDKDVRLRKTLQLTYHINGDEIYPGEDDVNTKESEWIMR